MDLAKHVGRGAGAADPDNPGWPSVGFAIEWGGAAKRTLTP